MTTLFNWSSYGSQNEEKTLLQPSQRCHKGEFRHVSISTQQRSLQCGQNLRGPFLRATLPDRALERWPTTGRQKGSLLHHQGEFLYNYYTFEAVHDGYHNDEVTIFIGLPASGEVSLITLHSIHYTAQFSLQSKRHPHPTSRCLHSHLLYLLHYS